MHVIAYFGSVQPLVDKVAGCRPDAVVVDALFGDPAEALAALAAAAPNSRLVVLADSVDGPLARAVVANGVRAVIMKSSPIADAIVVLCQVLDGGTSFPGCVLERLSERRGTDAAEPAPARGARAARARALERRDRVRALHLGNTVKFHLRVIYERLQVHNRVEAARLLAARRAT